MIVPLPKKASLPKLMTDCPHWIVWKAEKRDNKTAKVPIGSNGYASSMKEHHRSFDDAIAEAQMLRKRFGDVVGVGLAFVENIGIVGVDLDGSIQDGQRGEHLRWMMNRFPSWGEISLSGKGAHVFYRGNFNGKRSTIIDNQRVEIFGTKGFIAITGNSLDGCPDCLGEFKPLGAELAPHLEPIYSPPTPSTNTQASGQYRDSLSFRNWGLAALNVQCERVRSAPQGQLHYTLVSASASVGRGCPHILSFEECEQALYDAARDAGGQDMDNARRSIRGQLEFGSLNPSWPAEKQTPNTPTNHVDLSGLGRKEPRLRWVPFPVNSLPPVMRDLVIEGAKAIGCDEVLLVFPALAVVGGLVGTARPICVKKSWAEDPCFWAVTIAEPSSKKSPGYKMAISPLIRLQKELDLKHAQDLDKWAEAMLAWKEADEETRGDPPERPKKRELFVSDITIERLSEILQENDRGALFVRDEISAWFAALTRYQKDGESTTSQWLELWSKGTLKTHRKMGPVRDIFCPRALCSLAGTIQPGVLRKLLDAEAERGDSGIVARLMMAMPPALSSYWREDTVDDLTLGRWDVALEDAANLIGEKYLGMTKEAKDVWIRFHDEMESFLETANGTIRNHVRKLVAYSARLADIHYIVGRDRETDPDADGPIPLVSVEAGITITRWLLREIERVHDLLNSGDGGEWENLASKIQRKWDGSVTVRDLQRSNSKRYRKSEDAEKDLQTLVEMNFGKWEFSGRERRFTLTPSTEYDGRQNDTCNSAYALSDEVRDDTSQKQDDGPPVFPMNNDEVSYCRTVVPGPNGEKSDDQGDNGQGEVSSLPVEVSSQSSDPELVPDVPTKTNPGPKRKRITL